MMSELQKLEALTEDLKKYLQLNISILKLEATKQVSEIGSSLISSIIVVMAAFLFVFSLSIGLGFYLSAILGDSYSGFAIIAGFYLLLAIILFAGRKKMMKKPLRDKIIQNITPKI